MRIESIPRRRSLSCITIFSLGGAFADVGEQETTFGGSRQTRFVVNVTAIAPDAALLVADRAWARSMWQALVPPASGSGGYSHAMADPGADGCPAAPAPANSPTLPGSHPRSSPPPRPP